MRFMDLVPQRNIDDVIFDEDKSRLRLQIEEETRHFLSRGRNIEVIEYGATKEKMDGKLTGVTEMEDGTFRITLNGHLVGDGYYATRAKATATLLKYQFKDGNIND